MAQAQGSIVQCIGAVIDIEFPRDAMPNIYDALQLVEDPSNPLAEKGLTFEVEQQLGDGVVRTIALGSSDGLRRGMHVTNTDAPISVPVGVGTLGRRTAGLDLQCRSRPAGTNRDEGERNRSRGFLSQGPD